LSINTSKLIFSFLITIKVLTTLIEVLFISFKTSMTLKSESDSESYEKDLVSDCIHIGLFGLKEL